MLIGIMGRKSSGKDTFGTYLIEHYFFEKRAFADPLKECCQLLLGLSKEQLNDPLLKETVDPGWERTPREMMQTIGTDLLRNQFHSEIWLRSFQRWYLEHKDHRIVCTDVRFPNEAALIKSLGGILFKIERTPDPHSHCIDTHESEKIEIDHFDHLLLNHGTLQEFLLNIETLCNTLFSPLSQSQPHTIQKKKK